jgi:hypothetical protein
VGQLLGNVSERDLAVKGCGAGLNPGDVIVSKSVHLDSSACIDHPKKDGHSVQ